MTNFFLLRIILFCAAFGFIVNAQTLPINSYDKIGLGDFNFSENTSTQSMGGLSTIYNSPFGTELNFSNPAANANIKETVFHLGGSYNYSLYKNSKEKNSYGQSNFDRISLGFPINDKVKIGIGFRQNAFLNSEANSITQVSSASNSPTLTINNGGLNNLQSFVSYSASDKLTLGFKTEYIFGNYITEVSSLNKQKIGTAIVNTIIYDVNREISSKSKSNDKLTQGVFTMGAYYKIPFKKKQSFIMGATYGLGTSINFKSEGEVNTETTYALIDSKTNSQLSGNDPNFPIIYKNTSTTTTIPKSIKKADAMQTFSFGVGYEKEEKWMVGTDFQWNKTGVYGNLISPNITYQNRYRVALGGWWLPNKNSYKNYFQRITYRSGLFFEQTPYVLDGNNIKDIGASVGFGLPVGKKTESAINLGLEYINRGTSNGLATQVDYFGLRVGYNFSNKWFNKRLID